MHYNVWIDDVRKPPHMDNLVYFTNAEDAINWFAADEEVLTGDTFAFYLDHDLGNETAATGYDFCKFFIEWNLERCHKAKFHLLTANPVGAGNMRQLMKHYGYKEF